MLAQFGTQNDAAAFPHAAASGNRLWVAPKWGRTPFRGAMMMMIWGWGRNVCWQEPSDCWQD